MSSEPLWEQYKHQLEALTTAELNFDVDKREEFTEAAGWHLDEYEVELPSEPAGPPEPGGSWEVGQQVMREYRFADPTRITGIYYPDTPLAERVMLLRARFLMFTFYFGVRVGSVMDEVRETEEGPAQVWGFNYQTLKGHFEKGQMDFEIWKYLDSGRVFFRIQAFSQPDKIPNPFYRLGFKLFGRRLQRHFARQALKRMKRFVREEIAERELGVPAPEPEQGPSVQPASATTESAEQMEEAQEQAADERRAPTDSG